MKNSEDRILITSTIALSPQYSSNVQPIHGIQQLRGGHAVVAVVPHRTKGGLVRKAVVGLVMTVWVSSKKPKLISGGGVPINHVLAFRLVHFTEDAEGSGKWVSNNSHHSWILKPTAIVAVLDVAAFNDGPDGSTLGFTSACLQWLDDLPHIPSWFPAEISEFGDVLEDERFLPRQGRRGKGKGKGKGGKGKKNGGAEQGGEKPEIKKKKVKFAQVSKRLRKRKILEDLPFEVSNIRKNEEGRRLIANKLRQIKLSDGEVFSSQPLFMGDPETCRLKIGCSYGTLWSEIVNGAFSYFKALPLNLLKM